MKNSVSPNIPGIIVVCIFSIIAALIISLTSLANARAVDNKSEIIYGASTDDTAEYSVPFPRTNMFNHTSMSTCFGEAVPRPEVAVEIARAVLNGRMSNENHTTPFIEDASLSFDDAERPWLISAVDKGDVWFVEFERYISQGVIAMCGGRNHMSVTIRKADGKIISAGHYPGY